MERRYHSKVNSKRSIPKTNEIKESGLMCDICNKKEARSLLHAIAYCSKCRKSLEDNLRGKQGNN